MVNIFCREKKPQPVFPRSVSQRPVPSGSGQGGGVSGRPLQRETSTQDRDTARLSQRQCHQRILYHSA